jgi:hypothetical protein
LNFKKRVKKLLKLRKTIVGVCVYPKQQADARTILGLACKVLEYVSLRTGIASKVLCCHGSRYL